MYLNINVAKRSSSSRHKISDRNWGSINSQINNIIQSTVAAGWHVVQSDGSRDGIQAGLDVLILPDPPGTIDLCVVKPEGWISRGGEDVSTWVTADGEVTAGVDTEDAVSEVTLHDCLEPVDVGVVGDEVGAVVVGGPARRNPLGDITLEAAGVVDCAVVGDDFGFREGWCDWTKIYDHTVDKSARDGLDGSLRRHLLLKWTSLDTSSTISGRDTVEASRQSVGAVMGFIYAVSSHAVVGSIEYRRVNGVLSISTPVPVLSLR